MSKQQLINELIMNDFDVDNLLLNGQIERFKIRGRKHKDKAGWVCGGFINNSEKVCAIYGNWATGLKKKFISDGSSNFDIKQHEECIKKYKEQNKRKKQIAIQRITEIMLLPEAVDHPYCIKKQIKIPPCSRVVNKELIIPIYNQDKQLVGGQRILPDGSKKMIYGTSSGDGNYYPIVTTRRTADNNNNNNIICVCEGVATGMTIYEATDYTVLCALNAHNLITVAKNIREQRPNVKIIICADNDYATETKIGKNPGLDAGKDVSRVLNCDLVYPTNIKGTDFNDMSSEVGIDFVRQEILRSNTIDVMTADDFVNINDSLKIPDAAVPDGLIAEGVDALNTGGILQYTLPVVLTVISRSIGGKISCNGVYPNVFNIKVGGTSTGKTESDKLFRKYHNIEGFISMNEIASGAGLMRAISENPQGMAFFDEVKSLFMRNSNGAFDTIAESKVNALLDVYSNSGMSFTKKFGDAKNSIEVNNPCFSLIGNTTPQIFNAIQIEDFESGLMQRFDFWMYDGEILPKPIMQDKSWEQPLMNFIKKLRSLLMFMPPESSLTLQSLINNCIDLNLTSRAYKTLQEYSSHIVNSANKAIDASDVGFISRKFDLSLKYALIHHASMRKTVDLLKDINNDDIKYGILIAEMLCGWKLHVLKNKVVSGDFHQDCDMFVEGLIAAVKKGRKHPTFLDICDRRKKILNWLPKYSDNVITILRKRKKIILKEFNGQTRYYLPKK